MDSPLVSCIMPTANRREFVPAAIALFLAQDYPNRELLVIDDGDDCVADLMPADPRVRYLRLEGRHSIGTKRNLACEQARGELIAHWDDDDWYAPQRLSVQVQALQGSQAVLCGLDQVLFHEPASGKAWEYVYPKSERPWACGATLCYRRGFWQTHRFADIDIGEDNRFVWQVPPPQLLRLADMSIFVGRVHAANTSRKLTADARWRPVDPAVVAALTRCAPAWQGPGVTIGVVVDDDAARLQATLDALRRVTPTGIAIVLIADGVDAATHARLAMLTGYRLLGFDTARGGAACFNLLAQHADCEVIILLEAGAQPGPGWLARLLAPMREPRVGLCGPSTNRAWNMQQAGPCDGSPQAVARLAGKLAQQHGEGWRSTAPLYCLGDFCYAVRREVIAAIGLADEGYGCGPCWEMDYNVRAARAGFELAWVPAAFVYREPFTARRKADEARLFEASKRRYQDKFCARRLRCEPGRYDTHCTGDACPEFAPEALIRLYEPAGAVAPARLLLPLVSCIMPTRGRADYVARAVHYLARQDYAQHELIIVADSEADVPDAVRGQPGVSVLLAGARRSIGAKRNLACQHAHGEFIVHWDDDDWYAPTRLSRQLAPLLRREAEVCGLGDELYLDLAQWTFWRCSPALHRRMYAYDVFGGSLAYRRRLWAEGLRYPDVSLAEDAAFLNAAIARGARLARVPGGELLVYLRHGTNSWRFGCGDFLDPGGWSRVAEPDWFTADRTFYLSRSSCAAAQPG